MGNVESDSSSDSDDDCAVYDGILTKNIRLLNTPPMRENVDNVKTHPLLFGNKNRLRKRVLKQAQAMEGADAVCLCKCCCKVSSLLHGIPSFHCVPH
jgi:hypothetical protein